MTYMSKTRILSSVTIALAIATASGCATIAPEREAAKTLVGKNIQASYALFGNPVAVYKDFRSKPGDKHYGHTVYRFNKYGGMVTTDTVTGTQIDTSQGRPQQTEYHQVSSGRQVCIIHLFATPEGIVDDYQLGGNCGLWGEGLGNTPGWGEQG
jgi:hypothetical protein